MNNLLQAINSKLSGSDLFNDVGGRVFLDQALPGTDYPYIIFFIVSNVPDKTFTENFEDSIIQFSIFSNSQSAKEITTIYDDLIALFDECTLPIETDALLRMHRVNTVTNIEDISTQQGAVGVRHWAVDFSILIEKF